jgi:hypothetical protein
VIPGEAADLAYRINQTWRNGPSADVWEDELKHMDYGRSCTAYAKLRRERTHAPSVAEFVKMYRSLQTEDASTRGPDCATCDSTGWVKAKDITSRGHTYSAVKPCGCAIGGQMAASSIWKERKR